MLKRYPFTKQTGLKDCAAASVSMLVKYYHGYVSLHKLIKMLEINKNGTTAYHIVKTLKELGFDAYGVKEELIDTKIPFIANVILENSYKHFIVVYEVSKKYVLVADPIDRIKKLKIKDFKKIWTGIKICAYPNKPILKEKDITLKTLLKLISPKKHKLIIIFILSFLITILSILTAFFFQSMILSIDKDSNFIISVGLVFILLMFLNTILNYIRNHLLMMLVNSFDKSLTEESFESILKLPYNYYQGHTIGEISSKISEIKNIKEILGRLIITVFMDIPLLLFSGIVLLKLSKTLFSVVTLIALLYFVIIKIFSKKLNLLVDTYQRKKILTNSFITEAISGFETIKGISIESKINKIFKEKNKEYLNSDLKLKKVINLEYLFKDIVNILGQTSLIIVGILSVKSGKISLALLITYNALVTFFLEPIKSIINLDYEIFKLVNCLQRLLELSEEEIIYNYEKPKTIEYENVNFAYRTNNALKNINLKIENKNKIFVSGKSGSGKSTLFKLLKNYYKNYTGSIKVNGKDIKKCSPKINYISTKEIIFTGSIDYNIKINGSKNLKTKIEICQINEIIDNDILKHNFLLEENGFNISNGQRQRIILARSLNHFDVLIIDEALNSVNSDLERKILKKLLQVYRNKIIIFVSHRLDNLDLFERYIKLENGEIVLDEKKA